MKNNNVETYSGETMSYTTGIPINIGNTTRPIGHWIIDNTRVPVYQNPPNKIRQLIVGWLLGWKYQPNTNTKQLLNG